MELEKFLENGKITGLYQGNVSQILNQQRQKEMNLQNTVYFTSFKKTNIAIHFNHLVQVCLSLSPLSICYVLSNHLNVSSNLVVSDNFNGRFICHQALNHRRCDICHGSLVTTLEEN